jgi:hypothetical protein
MSDLLRESPPLPTQDQRLVDAYARLGRPSDDLPYSSDFDMLLDSIRAAGDTRSEQEVIQRLFRLRKAGRLPHARRPSIPVSDVPTEDVELAEALLRDKLGTLGSRDQLPYTPEFEQLWQDYRTKATRPLDRHQFWRLVARVSK